MFGNAHLMAEVRNALLVAGLVAAYALLAAPYVVRTKVDQITKVPENLHPFWPSF